MAAKKKVDGRTKAGRALKAKKSTGALLKKKRASVAKAKKVVKAKAGTKVRVVKQKVGKQRTARLVKRAGKLVPEPKAPRKGSVVVTEKGVIGRLESIDAQGNARVIVFALKSGRVMSASMPASRLFTATEGEKRIHAFLSEFVQSLVDAEVRDAERKPYITTGGTFSSNVIPAIMTTDVTTGLTLAIPSPTVVSSTIAGGTVPVVDYVNSLSPTSPAFNVVERAEEALDADVRVSPDPEAAREAIPEV